MPNDETVNKIIAETYGSIAAAAQQGARNLESHAADLDRVLAAQQNDPDSVLNSLNEAGRVGAEYAERQRERLQGFVESVNSSSSSPDSEDTGEPLDFRWASDFFSGVATLFSSLASSEQRTEALREERQEKPYDPSIVDVTKATLEAMWVAASAPFRNKDKPTDMASKDHEFQFPERAALQKNAPTHVQAVNVHEDIKGNPLPADAGALIHAQHEERLELQQKEDVPFGAHVQFVEKDVVYESKISRAFGAKAEEKQAELDKMPLDSMSADEIKQHRKELASLNAGRICHRVFGAAKSAFNPVNACSSDFGEFVNETDRAELSSSTEAIDAKKESSKQKLGFTPPPSNEEKSEPVGKVKEYKEALDEHKASDENVLGSTKIAKPGTST